MELGVETPTILFEASMLKNGYFVGRKFVFEGYTASWLAESDLIRIWAGTDLVREITGEGESRESEKILKKAA